MTDRDLIPSYWFARTDEEGAGPTYVVGRGDEEITYPCLFRHEAEAIVNALRDRLAQPEFDSALQSAAMTQTAPKLAQPEPVGEIVQAFADLTAVSIPVMPPVGTKLYTAPLDRMAENARELGLDYEPVQEPVALETVYETIIQWDEGGGKRSRRELARRIVALYTTPPRREWMGLTDEEVMTLDDQTHFHEAHDWTLRFARAIEAKLREKNA